MKSVFSKCTIALLFCALFSSTMLLAQSNNRTSGNSKELGAGIKVPVDYGNTTIFYPEEPLKTNKGNGRLDTEPKKVTDKTRQVNMVANPTKLKNGKIRYEFHGIIAKGANQVKPGDLVVFQSKNGQSFAAAKIGADGRFMIYIDSEKDIDGFIGGIVVVGGDGTPYYFDYCYLPRDTVPMPTPLSTGDDIRLDACGDAFIIVSNPVTIKQH